MRAIKQAVQCCVQNLSKFKGYDISIMSLIYLRHTSNRKQAETLPLKTS